MKRKGFNNNRLMDKLVLEIRNVQVVTFWDILSMFTKMLYKEKIDYLMKNFHLGKRILKRLLRKPMRIFRENESKDWGRSIQPVTNVSLKMNPPPYQTQMILSPPLTGTVITFVWQFC